MKSQQSLPDSLLRRRLKEAETAWNRKDFHACIESLESAHRLAPANVQILLQLGRTYGLRYRYADAGRSFDQALRLTPNKAAVLGAIVEHCDRFRHPELPEQYLRQVLALPEATPDQCVKLAVLCERYRRMPEAQQLVERALALDSHHPAALLVRARLERTAGRLEAAEQIIRSFITRPVADTWTHVQSWYELGNILDRQKRFDEAMSAFVTAKKLWMPQAAGHLAELKNLRTRLKVMEANVTAAQLQRWFGQLSSLPPTRRVTLLCGHARSGTTLLEQVLDAHPDIVSADETDIFMEEVFSPLRNTAPLDVYMLPLLESAAVPKLQQLRASYFRIMECSIGRPIDNRLLIDKSPMANYLIPAFIRVFPETKFLIALRDPRDVVLSCFSQLQTLTNVTSAYLTLEGGVEDYATMMGIWRTLKPLIPGHYMEVRYENVVQDLESEARKTLDFLGVSWNDKVLGFDEHARRKMVASPTYADVTQPIYKRAQGRWRNYQKYLEPHLPILEPFVKAFGYE